jgi:hypothetical protein
MLIGKKRMSGRWVMRSIKNCTRGSLAGCLAKIIFISSLASGCATFNADSYVDHRIHQNKLPLTLAIDSTSLDTALNFSYTDVRTKQVGLPEFRPNSTIYTYEVSSQKVTNTDCAHDARYIIDKSFGAILSSNQIASGTLRVEMTRSTNGTSCLPCALLAATIVPYFAGIPAVGHFSEVDLAATIVDKAGQPVAQYKRTGRHTSWDAIWGYSNGIDIKRGASAGAIAEAVALIINDINKDSDRVSNKLLGKEG